MPPSCNTLKGSIQHMKIAHIINPVKIGPKSDLYFAQPVTFETMRRAKDFASGHVEVEQYTTQYSEDHEVLPKGFTILPDLARSVLDIKQFKHQRKLPILADILSRLYEASDADYFIYTNVDIAVMPSFYVSVAALLEKYDGLVINRRTISNFYTSLAEIPLMYTEIGEKHLGYDCFIFRRDSFTKMQLGTACIGAVQIGQLFYANIIANCRNFREMRDCHLTFHLGNDRVWYTPENEPYKIHNEREAKAALRQLREYAGPFDSSTPIGQFLRQRYLFQNSVWLKSVLDLDNSPESLRVPFSVRVNKLKHKIRMIFEK
jgi:hypothetical protein